MAFAQRPPPSRAWRALAFSGAVLSLAACATAPPPPRLGASEARPRAYNRPYQVRGRWYAPADQPGYDRTGLASWYSYESRSRTTADGEPFDARLATAAHTTLPLPSWLEVTNLANGRSARVRLNDRGPFVSGRILDVSRAAAVELGFLQQGTARVRVRYLGPAEPLAGEARTVWASAASPPPRRRLPAAPHLFLAQARVPAPPPPFGAYAPAAIGMDGGAPTGAEAEVDKDLADFAGDDATTGPEPAVPAPGPRYGVQAGAFADRSNAERAASRLAGAGPAEVLPLDRPDGERLYRVVVGRWPGAEAAADARARIAALGFADAKVVGR